MLQPPLLDRRILARLTACVTTPLFTLRRGAAVRAKADEAAAVRRFGFAGLRRTGRSFIGAGSGTRRLKVTSLGVALAVGALLFCSPGAAGQTPSDIAVVVHSGVPIDSLSIGELRRVVLGDREFWPSNIRIVLLIRAPVARERDVVLKTICGMSEAQFRQHWIGKVFRAETVTGPKIVYSADMALESAGRTPGAITFVDASAELKGVKVVKIDGRLPGQAGYALR